MSGGGEHAADGTRPLGTGDSAPIAEGRTDEGTPISLADFKGRALAVFLLGRGIKRGTRTLLAQLARRTPEFLAAECSPVAVSTEPAEMLAELRDASALPFLMISDTELGIHRALAGAVPAGPSGVWLFDKAGAVVATVPALGFQEQISAALAALDRVRAQRGS
jgi:peroxiredoxin